MGAIMKKLGIGMIGYGFIGKVHTLAYKNLDYYYDNVPADINMVGVYSRNIENANLGVKQGGYKFATDDYEEIINNDEIDVIDICTPNYLHKEIFIKALEKGKHVHCEKPLALNLSDAKEILKISKKYPRLKTQITFEYRYQPAIMRAKQLIEDGFLGKVFSVRGAYLHSGYIDPERPISWRLQKKYSGGGALYDMGSHLIDLTRFLLGDFSKVFLKQNTFIKKRPLRDKIKKVDVDVDDISILLFEMANGAMGTIEASRLATGSNDELRLEIHGQKGAIKFNSMQPNFLEAYDTRSPGKPIGGKRGFIAIETVQRYPKPANQFPGPKFTIGWLRYSLANTMDFIINIVEDRKPSTGIIEGYKTQETLEAAIISNKEKKWINLPLKI